MLCVNFSAFYDLYISSELFDIASCHIKTNHVFLIKWSTERIVKHVKNDKPFWVVVPISSCWAPAKAEGWPLNWPVELTVFYVFMTWSKSLKVSLCGCLGAHTLTASSLEQVKPQMSKLHVCFDAEAVSPPHPHPSLRVSVWFIPLWNASIQEVFFF